MRAARAALVAAVAALAFTTALRAGDEPAPARTLANEDVVRMVASGLPESEILESIRTHTAAFDVSDDMVEELRLAGVPATIIAAMKAQQARGVADVLPVERPRAGRTRVIVAIGPGGARTLRAPGYADEDAKARLHLAKAVDQRRVRDLAVFLACATAEHIPDLWRSKTPLGRDMNLIARHEMLAFVPGDTPPGKTPRLTVPATLEADVDDTETHDLVFGVAAWIGDHWVQVAAAVLPKMKAPPGATPLRAQVAAGARPLEYAVSLAAPAR